jgi:glycosyltransferase involved in cell wall biosynthesis
MNKNSSEIRILLLSRYGDLGPSSRVRFYQYIPYLKEENIHITVAPLFSNQYIENLYSGKSQPASFLITSFLSRLKNIFHVNRYDIVWLEGELFPYLPAWFEKIITWLNVPLVVDYDDAIFHRYDMSRNPLIRTFMSKKIDHIMRMATVVVAGNTYLAEHAQQSKASKIEIIPSVIDLNRYPKKESSVSDVFTIGWIGSPSTQKNLTLIESALQQLNQKHPFRLILVGANKSITLKIPYEIHSWSYENEVNEIQTFDVGIMPLIDEPFERGKCGYKLIQYMACSKPVIASPVGANCDIIEHEKNGFLAQSEEDWINALSRLIENPSLCANMGYYGRQLAQNKYCITAALPQLIQIFHTARKSST